MNSVGEPLKKRKLAQWAVAYLAGAWVTLQVLDLVGDKFGWPDAVGRIAIAILGVGFLAVLVLAWFHGEKGQQRVSGVELAMLAGILVLAGAAVMIVRGDGEAAPGDAAAPAPATAGGASRTSIAVLPFESISADVDNAYFASGIHDELLTQLSKLGALEVISRTSVLTYKDSKKTLRQIGAELGVGSVLRGSVQRAGNKVRVQAQLSDASTDKQLWADRYDRELTDIFAIQSDIAQQIAGALQARLTTDEKASLERQPTDNAEAYDLYLRGLAYQRTPTSDSIAARLYEQAIALDPDFALAHARLSYMYGSMYWLNIDPTPARRAKQRAAAERALQLQPGLAEAHLAMGFVHYWGSRDYQRALDEFSTALRIAPSDADLHMAIALVHRRQGKFDQAITGMQKAQTLDPRNGYLFQQAGDTYRMVRRYPDAVKMYDRALFLAPDDYAAAWAKGLVYFSWRGQLDSLQAFVSRLSRFSRLAGRVPAPFVLARLNGDKAGAMRAAQAAPEILSDYSEYTPRELLVGWAHQWQGDRAAARTAFDLARVAAEKALRTSPDDPRMHIALGYALAGLGRGPEAQAASRRAVALLPVSKDAVLGPDFARDHAAILAQTGDAEGAIAQIEQLLARPSHLSLNELRRDPIWDPIRSHPRFQALLTASRY